VREGKRKVGYPWDFHMGAQRWACVCCGRYQAEEEKKTTFYGKELDVRYYGERVGWRCQECRRKNLDPKPIYLHPAAADYEARAKDWCLGNGYDYDRERLRVRKHVVRGEWFSFPGYVLFRWAGQE
jgi:hypothetical protein